MTIDLPLNTVSGWMVVKADLLDNWPHLWPHTFALHNSYGEWRVSHVETGCHLSSGATKRLAIESADKQLRDRTVADVDLGWARADVPDKCAEET